MDCRKDPGRIAEVLRELGADIVGLQEVDSKPGEDSRFELTRELAKTTDFHVTPGVTILRYDEHYGNVLLTGASRGLHSTAVPGQRSPSACRNFFRSLALSFF
jgi:endonuclease/exonuclease/phosphatase family metal-dependent hydrolase